MSRSIARSVQRLTSNAGRVPFARAISNAAGNPLNTPPAPGAAPAAAAGPSSHGTGRTTHFGFQEVPEEEKETLGE